MNMQHYNTDVKRPEAGECNVITLSERGGLPSVREEYIGAIQHWCQTRDLSDALSREEIGALDKFDRVDAQRKAFLLNQIHYYRRHPRADVAPGVAAIIHFLSDNDKGASTVSQATMAKLLNRSLSSIADAHRRLREDGIIVTGRGRYPMTYPVIPRAVTQSYNHMTWLLAAVVDASEKLFNLPAPPDDRQSSGQTRELKSIIRPDPMIEKINHPVEANSIIRPDPMQYHYKNSNLLEKAARVVSAGIATAIGSLPAAATPREPPAIIHPAGPSLAQMTDRMVDAAGAALANPAACPGLLMYSELQRWLASGHDFEGDILPAIKARCARAAPGVIKSWAYFSQAVADAKMARLAPMPEGRAASSQLKQREPWQVQKDKEQAALEYLMRKR